MKKLDKLVVNLHDKTEYVIHIKNLKQALNDGLVLKKIQRNIRFNQEAWLKTLIKILTWIQTKKESEIRFLQRLFSNWWIMQLLEKLWKMRENIEILKF